MAKEQKNVDLVYRGYSVSVTPTGKFTVHLNEDEDRTNDTYDGLKQAIDRWDSASEKLKKAKFEPVAVIDEEGKEYKITGLHAGHGKVLLKPPMERWSSNALYLDCKAVRIAHAELLHLKAEVERKEDYLRLFSIAREPGTYGDDVEQRLAALHSNIKTAISNSDKADRGTLPVEPRKKLRL